MKKASSKPLRVLITGATGLLGTHLLLTKPENVEVYATLHQYRKTLKSPSVSYVDLDVRDEKAVARVVQELHPDVIIHTAAHGRVDYCEQHQEDAYATNVKATKTLVDQAKSVNARIFFCSTNMTFDGMNPPYAEDSEQKPASYYGKNKVEAETYIRASGVNFTIFRLMTMYGWNWQPARKNMISMLIEKLSLGEKLWMTNDVWNNLLFAREAAAIYWYAVQHPELSNRETFQLAGKDRVNRFQATMAACEVFDLKKSLVAEVTSDYFKGQEVARSPDTTFDTTKAERVLHFKPLDLLSGLEHMKLNRLPTSYETR